jgi:hypothetical protein
MNAAKCPKFAVCFYFGKRAKYPVSDGEHKTIVSSRCETDYAKCAIFQVIDKVGFLKCPADLKPSDAARVASFLAK